jgi:membrane protease YdiL (CAAX protease family)
MHIHIGKRIIKTAITLFLVLLIYIGLLGLDNLLEISHGNFKAPSNMYTPFFAGIAAVYATHQNKKLSIKQAKVRSVGSLVGGYFGMIIVFLAVLMLLNGCMKSFDSQWVEFLVNGCISVGISAAVSLLVLLCSKNLRTLILKKKHE